MPGPRASPPARPKSSRNTATQFNREPTSALKTYSNGNVAANVRRNKAGVLTVAAASWPQTGPVALQRAKDPMQAL